MSNSPACRPLASSCENKEVGKWNRPWFCVCRSMLATSLNEARDESTLAKSGGAEAAVDE